MWLIVPDHSDYKYSADVLQDFFLEQNLSYCIYGSFLVPKKLKPGLSDIDVMAISKDKSALFPISITKVFGKIREEIRIRGIPLQINWVTQGQLNSIFLSPDANYLEEVSRWLKWEYVSSDFQQILQKKEIRNPEIDDAHMARHFFRKITELGALFYTVSWIIGKPMRSITHEEQKKLCSFWDGFKKMVSFLALTMRIRDRVSYFSRSHTEVLALFQQSHNLWTIDMQEYTHDLESIKNIEDWFLYLQNGWLKKIEDFYTHIFTPFIDATKDYK